MKLFIDTGAHIALIDKSDQFHEKAKGFYMDHLGPSFQLVTTNFVICETMNFLRTRLPKRFAIKFWEDIKVSELIDIIHISTILEEEAFRLLKTYSDKDFSFTDCTSFVVMKKLGLDTAFTFDHHFEQFGFRKLPVIV